jgi:hypothetical protein
MLSLDLAGLVRASGRSWWEARYSRGRVVTEWDVASSAGVLPHLVEAGHWDALERDGLVGVRLVCPNGAVAELASRDDHRLFQFKAGGAAAVGGRQLHWCSAQVIGAVVDASGACVCRAWETAEQRLVEFQDNVYAMRYRSVGPLSLEHLGVRI